MKIGAIVLAAGEGRRFGGNKLLAKVGDEPVILRVLKALSGFDRVVIVGAYVNELMPYLSNEVIIYNPYYRDGMSTSIRLGLRFFQDYDAVLIVLTDMPLITNEVVSRIVSAYHDGCSAVVPTHNGIRGNPVLIHRVLFPELTRLSGDVGAREILRGRVDVCTVECGPEVLIDIDTVNDLTKVLNIVNTNRQ
ncbi:nucleotidyltransferase family protein [Vulcanisaeta souniana]|uniref:4-diphosphocytidyl-2C-methyl-D-erythritol kinase n=1 Tax=Vulcanisaeta souniana JCM 11219 TaxID=1293586 RepID=A0A830DYQ6_9CREN|nr:nucleotidyltransferase family protein [Vulcanisaeta souniana]BDR91876.1 4-diphosphocytidyl-2C-methyl-D-erythritol kinase [Vulcanisaeta souniana JCM 11219]GGI69662.1 4-diphosphocytidyl-2C-methyl-D-erythritol kinase [Vulcanisaeta souniana JCM 11219]